MKHENFGGKMKTIIKCPCCENKSIIEEKELIINKEIYISFRCPICGEKPFIWNRQLNEKFWEIARKKAGIK